MIVLVVCANSGVVGKERRRDWWRKREVRRGERTAWRCIVNRAEMVEGKMKIELRRARAEWIHRGRNTVFPI